MTVLPEPVAILADPRNTRGAQEYARLLKKTFRSQGIALAPHVAEDTASIVTLGGDGWLLSCVARYWRKERAFLGVNFGRKGFLLNDPPRDQSLLLRDITAHEFPLLLAELTHTDGASSRALALNDVYFNRMGQQSVHLKVCVNDTVLTENLVGDGILVATALGSTAYNLAVGGPPLNALLREIALSPICAYAPRRLEPMVLPLDTVITIEVLESKKRRVLAGVDTRCFRRIARAVIRDSEETARLLFCGEPDFTRRLRDKIMEDDR